jgi:hypothetical protein
MDPDFPSAQGVKGTWQRDRFFNVLHKSVGISQLYDCSALDLDPDPHQDQDLY